jgi:ABC-2 type transport system ATP-binding protein
VAVVEVDSLSVHFGDITAVDKLSFSAAAGAVTVLLGPNGAGKTTSIECIEGFRRPTSGVIRVDGLDPVADHRSLTRIMGVMLQDGGIYTGIRPLEVLRLFAAYYDNPRDPQELLELVGLDHRRRSSWRSLSGGEQQRLSLALAVLGQPKVAMLDEPTAGVDLSGKQMIRQVIDDLRQEGVAVVLTTHDLEEAEHLADRIVIIDQGRVVADGSPDALLSNESTDSFTFRARPGLDAMALGIALDTPVREESPGSYRVFAAPDPNIVAQVTNWLAAANELLGDLRAGRSRLDELFARLTTEPEPQRHLPGGRRKRRAA